MDRADWFRDKSFNFLRFSHMTWKVFLSRHISASVIFGGMATQRLENYLTSNLMCPLRFIVGMSEHAVNYGSFSLLFRCLILADIGKGE
jgi:hypothetical protein